MPFLRPLRMSRLRTLLHLLAIVLGCLLLPAAAQAAGYDASGFRFSSDNYTVHQSDGDAVITIARGDTSREARAYYVAVGIGHDCGGTGCTAVPPHNWSPPDFITVNGSLDFPAGVASESFTVPIVNHGFSTLNKTFQVDIFNAYPQGIANPSKAVVTILGDEATAARSATNPLDLPVAPTNGDPLSGARFYIDHHSKPWNAMDAGNPGLRPIAEQPYTARFGWFSHPNPGEAVNRYLVTAATFAPGTVPMLATYTLVDSHCGHWTPTAADQADYHNFITSFAQGIGSFRAVLFLEEDSLITTPCLTAQGVSIRMNELRDAINVLTADCPHLVIYLDGGAADALPARVTANLLERAGVSQVQGFFLNSTHFDWTSNEIRYGEAISRMTGGKHFVVNTGFNGRGPLAPPDRARQGNEVLCNPTGRGLGPKPTANTGYLNVDAFAWTTDPGESFGPCGAGAPPLGDYWPAYGMMLIRNADYAVDHPGSISAYRVSSGSSAAQPARKAESAQKANKAKRSRHHVRKNRKKPKHSRRA
jgi:endoglucanase